jgi:D-alanyl-D-alanine dipeptidase/CubicO group peptidase (beta-lactamase class C family)
MMRASSLLLLFAGALTAADVPANLKYAAAVAELEKFIRHEVEQKNLPALSIALVDGQRIVWSAGFGFADAIKARRVDADTVFRVDADSELCTDLCLMQLVEQKKLDLDALITKYVPELRPDNPFGGSAMTLRQLMAHQSGLVRELPRGSYFDPEPTSLAKAITSLNGIKLAFKPTEKFQHSSANRAVVRRVLEVTQNLPAFAIVQDRLLAPLEINHPRLRGRSVLSRNFARGMMQTLYGRDIPAPTADEDISNLFSVFFSVTDEAKLLRELFAGSIVKPSTLELMMTPAGTETEGAGLGLHMAHLGGRRLFEHTEGVYGVTSHIAGLPDEKLGVAIITNRENAHALMSRIAAEALSLLVAVREASPITKIETSNPIDWQSTKLKPGYYKNDESTKPLVRIERHHDQAWLWLLTGGTPAEIRQHGDVLQTDDVISFGAQIESVTDKGFKIGEQMYHRLPDAMPPPPPSQMVGLVAEYGYENHTVYILEEAERLYAIMDWHFLEPLRPEHDDEFAFLSNSRHAGESVVFHRDAVGRSTEVIIGGVTYPRRIIPGEGSPSFRIQPERPVEVLMKEALVATPPPEKGEFAKPDLVDLATLDTTIKFDIRYSTANNFLGASVYPVAVALMQRPAAQALLKAHRDLANDGYGLLIHDAYRPWHVTKVFWEATPKAQRIFVADPNLGSRHNRGCAVDLTLYELKTGQAVTMTGGYDEFSDRSYPRYPGGTSLQRWHREKLRAAMEANGFNVYEAEWWHFDYRDWKKYPVLNVALSEFKR